jgi:dihydroorotate dehydrogenase (fumarate)
MANLSTRYMGLELRNPIIVGSSGLTSSLENIKELVSNGAGAIVLKSLFEEQIRYEINKTMNQNEALESYYPEAQDYISNYARDHQLDNYLKLISDAKAAVEVPIIASINCVSADEWTSFAKRIEAAGADALELNIFILPADPNFTGDQNEKVYFDIVAKIKNEIKIPFALKISYHFSGLAKTALKLSWAGAKGIVLFNRFYSPDINLDTLKVVPSNVFSTPEEISTSLRWVAMLSDRLYCDIAASTGVHDGKGVVKQLLAGAKAVQIASTLYKNGFGRIGEMLEYIESWMKEHNYQTTDEFIGKLSLKKTENPAAWERVQFMKHFAGIE